MKKLTADIFFALKRKCPVCRKGDLFPGWLDFTPYDTCSCCGTALKAQDVGDGAIVFLIFILGFTIIPGAVIWEFASAPSVWLQAAVWMAVSLVTIFALTPVIKAYIMLLQYRHRKSDWKK